MRCKGRAHCSSATAARSEPGVVGESPGQRFQVRHFPLEVASALATDVKRQRKDVAQPDQRVAIQHLAWDRRDPAQQVGTIAEPLGRVLGRPSSNHRQASSHSHARTAQSMASSAMPLSNNHCPPAFRLVLIASVPRGS